MDTLIVVETLANGLLSFVYLPLVLIVARYYFHRRVVLPKRHTLLLLGIFFTFCGIRKVLEVVNAFYPIDNIRIGITLLTAFLGLICLFLLPPLIEYLTKMKTPIEYEQLLDKLKDNIQHEKVMLHNVQELNHTLANKVQYYQSMIATQGWLSSSQMKLDELKEIVVNLRKQYKAG